MWANLGVKGTGITTSEEEDTTEQDLDYGTAARKVTEEFRENTLELQGEQDERGAFVKPKDSADAESKRATKRVRRKLQTGVTKEGDGAVDRRRIADDENIRKKLEQLEKAENEALEKEIQTRGKKKKKML